VSRLWPERVAFVRDWLTVYGGADRTMEAALDLFPDAPIYALVYQRPHFVATALAARDVRTSFIDRAPGGRRWYRAYLPLMPLAIEQFDLRPFDLVVSMSHLVAKGVLTRADQLHIAYVFTPVRYGWDLYFAALDTLPPPAHLVRGPLRLLLHYLRLWDLAAASRPDVLVAASQTAARRIWKTYRRAAQVIAPPVEIDRFRADRPRDDFYLTVSRLVPYKRVALLVEAFNRLRRPLVVIGDGPERRRLARRAGPTIRLLGEQPDEVVAEHMERCRAFVYAAEEDFGIALVEAQAAGAPVIAYGRGGAGETVIPGETGILFTEQSVDAVVAAVEAFEAAATRFHPERIRLTTTRFSRQRFQEAFAALIDREWARFKGHVPAAVLERTPLAV
jgi:glycosyltransferase involved in cell wall biosynthesis